MSGLHTLGVLSLLTLPVPLYLLPRLSGHSKVFVSLFSSVTLLELVQNFSEPLPLVELQGLYPPHVRHPITQWSLCHVTIM